MHGSEDDGEHPPGHRGDRDEHRVREDATRNAVETTARSLRDLRVGEVVRLDVTIEDGRVTHYRPRVNISFKYELEHAGH